MRFVSVKSTVKKTSTFTISKNKFKISPTKQVYY